MSTRTTTFSFIKPERTDTIKTTISNLASDMDDIEAQILNSRILQLTISGVTELPVEYEDSRITASHIPVRFYLSNPQIQAGKWTCTVTAGKVKRKINHF